MRKDTMNMNFKKRALFQVIILVILTIPNTLIAHDGPVDSDGCHLDGKGRLHCH